MTASFSVRKTYVECPSEISGRSPKRVVVVKGAYGQMWTRKKQAPSASSKNKLLLRRLCVFNKLFCIVEKLLRRLCVFNKIFCVVSASGKFKNFVQLCHHSRLGRRLEHNYNSPLAYSLATE